MQRHILSLLLIATVSIALYANTFNNGFVYDDKDTIVGNIFIHDLSNFKKLFNKEYFVISGEMTYRPVVTATYMLDCALFGTNPWGFHLTNILIHALNGVILYVFFTLLIEESEVRTKSGLLPNIPLLLSLLFASHPILTETVNAISYREDLLVFLFYITTLSLYLILRKRSSLEAAKGVYLLSTISYSLALLSKEMAITLPLIIYCCEWSYCNKRQDARPRLFNSYNAGYIITAFIYIYLRYSYYYRDTDIQIRSWDLAVRILTVPWLLLNYLKITFFPVSLSADYVITPIRSFSSALFIIPMITILILLIVIFTLKKKEKNIAAGILFFIIMLIPIYNIIPIFNPFAERYLYLPVIGFIIAAGITIIRLSEKICIKKEISFYTFFTILIIYSILVINRNGVWRNDYSLWSDTVRKMPDSSLAHNNLGLALTEMRQFNEAGQQLQIAINLKPNYQTSLDAHANLGLVYSKQQRYNEAIKEYQYVLTRRPNEPIIHNNLGSVYHKLYELDRAIHEFKTATKLNPNIPIFYYNLGLALMDQRQPDKAIQAYETALRLKPDYFDADIGLKIALHLMREQKKERESRKK